MSNLDLRGSSAAGGSSAGLVILLAVLSVAACIFAWLAWWKSLWYLVGLAIVGLPPAVFALLCAKVVAGEALDNLLSKRNAPKHMDARERSRREP